MSTILIISHQVYILSVWLVDGDFDHLAIRGQVFVRYLPCKVTPLPLLSHYAQPTLKIRSYASSSWGQSIYNTLFWVILYGRFVYSPPLYLYCFGIKKWWPGSLCTRDSLVKSPKKLHVRKISEIFLWHMEKQGWISGISVLFSLIFLYMIYFPFHFFSTTVSTFV